MIVEFYVEKWKCNGVSGDYTTLHLKIAERNLPNKVGLCVVSSNLVRGKFMNIILDTNAIRYLFEIKHNKVVQINLNKKTISSSKFLEICMNAKTISVMSESYFELFFQSYKSTKNINDFAEIYQFLNEFARNNKQELFIINQKDAFYFDSEKFAKTYNNKDNLFLSDYLPIRVENESKIMCSLIYGINYALFATIFDSIYDVDFGMDFWKKINKFIQTEVSNLYKKYYIDLAIDINDFETEIDKMIFEVFIFVNQQIKMLKELSEKTEISIPDVNVENSGSKYIKKLFAKLNNRTNVILNQLGKSPQELYKYNLNEYLSELKSEKNFSELQILYYREICEQFIQERKIRKNDIIDCSIISSLNVKDEIFTKYKEPKFLFITFDKFLFRFCRDNRIMFDEEQYNSLFAG